jgi:hypothetical protein
MRELDAELTSARLGTREMIGRGEEVLVTARDREGVIISMTANIVCVTLPSGWKSCAAKVLGTLILQSNLGSAYPRESIDRHTHELLLPIPSQK